MVAAALAAPLMTDPDLASQNRVGVALTGSAMPAAPIPTEDLTDEARAAALSDAAAQLGGAIGPAPAATGSQGAAAGETALLSWRQTFGPGPCADRAGWTFAWAARMPQAFPVFPRGHVQEAAGNDDGDCHLRALNFRTQAEVPDVLGFYHAVSRQAGYSVLHRADGEAHVLTGSRNGAGYAVYVRPGAEGMTEVDLVTSGT